MLELSSDLLGCPDLLGQLIRAALLACPDNSVKSLHAVFAREGRSFASLTITAYQPHAVLARAAVSMLLSEDGPEDQDGAPVSTLLDEAHRVELDLIPLETNTPF